jgi:hypothetical protein
LVNFRFFASLDYLCKDKQINPTNYRDENKI